MRICGWKQEKQLRHYAKIFKETVFADVVSAGMIPKQKTEKKKEPVKQIVFNDEQDLKDFQELLGI